MAGYSKTPLAKKLGLKPNMHALIMNAPKEYTAFFEDIPENIDFNTPGNTQFDFIHAFLKSKDQLQKDFFIMKNQLKPTGILWVSWPKQKKDNNSDLSRDFIREFIFENGLVDVKVCAINETWSALKFVYRLSDR